MKELMNLSHAAALLFAWGVFSGCTTLAVEHHKLSVPTYGMQERPITVDGDLSDWQGIAPDRVEGADHLWFGQGMTPEKWSGNQDLSYSWRGAYSGDRLFFLVEVTDDHVVEAGQRFSYLCDCIEIYLDYKNRGGKRVCVMDGRSNWFAKCYERELMGYELHFLPTQPVRVYLDHRHKYALDRPQTDEFRCRWQGEAVCKRTTTGYSMEIGFSIPNLPHLKPGTTLGVEIGVCDNDGNGRESIMMWTGTKSDFWLRMDEYGKVTLMQKGSLK